MSNELKHGSVGTELTQAEWEGIGTHVLESQAAGDIIYASSTSQLRRLAKGTDTHVLILSSGVPAWSATTGITTVGTIATGVWQGTDVGVAYGGTGVSTHTQNGVLVGNGSSAIGSIDMSTKGHVLIGDGSGNPQMLGVGTNDHVMTADSGETTGVKWAAPAAAAAGSLTGSTLASGVTASSLTSVGTIATGVWEGTDVGVAHGGTGVSTLLTNAILTGNGTSAIQAESSLLFSSNKMIPTASAHNAVGTALTVSSGATTAGTTDNIAGGALTFQGGQGKGSGAGGDIIFQTANAGGSGSSLNALATAVTISDDLSVTLAGDLTVSAGDIDLNNQGGLLNVGVSGNDWGETALAHASAVDSGTKALYLHNSSDTNDAATRALLDIIVNGGSGDNETGDPLITVRVTGGANWALGVDNSEDDRFTIANNTELGTSGDALRISTGEIITFQNDQGANFDYACDGCGKTSLSMFECCGTVEWHDDTAALTRMAFSEEGLQHMAKIGVMEVDDTLEERWLGINMQPAMNFTWGAVRQNRQRMDSQYDELNKRLEAIGA